MNMSDDFEECKDILRFRVPIGDKAVEAYLSRTTCETAFRQAPCKGSIAAFYRQHRPLDGIVLDKVNHLNSRLYCVCSINCLSERMEYSTCSSMARNSFSGAMLGCPPLMSSSYIRVNNSPNSASALLTIVRMTRNG